MDAPPILDTLADAIRREWPQTADLQPCAPPDLWGIQTTIKRVLLNAGKEADRLYLTRRDGRLTYDHMAFVVDGWVFDPMLRGVDPQAAWPAIYPEEDVETRWATSEPSWTVDQRPMLVAANAELDRMAEAVDRLLPGFEQGRATMLVPAVPRSDNTAWVLHRAGCGAAARKKPSESGSRAVLWHLVNAIVANGVLVGDRAGDRGKSVVHGCLDPGDRHDEVIAALRRFATRHRELLGEDVTTPMPTSWPARPLAQRPHR